MGVPFPQSVIMENGCRQLTVMCMLTIENSDISPHYRVVFGKKQDINEKPCADSTSKSRKCVPTESGKTAKSMQYFLKTRTKVFAAGGCPCPFCSAGCGKSAQARHFGPARKSCRIRGDTKYVKNRFAENRHGDGAGAEGRGHDREKRSGYALSDWLRLPCGYRKR